MQYKHTQKRSFKTPKISLLSSAVVVFAVSVMVVGIHMRQQSGTIPVSQLNKTGSAATGAAQVSAASQKAATVAASTTKPTVATPTKPLATQTTSTKLDAQPAQAYQAIAAPSPHGAALYVDPTAAQADRPARITSQPTATWFGGWIGDVTAAANNLVTASTASGSLATIITYNIPDRDCGGYSAGGVGSSAAYRQWIRSLAAGIGNRQVIVVLEPDALAQIGCLAPADQATRYADLADAVNVLATQTKAFVYLDAGHSGWIDAATMASRLAKANVGQARGFSLNVSNFQSSPSNIAYGDQLSARTGKSYVIDTSRNGHDVGEQWCNPAGAALGTAPTTNTTGNLDAFLWLKQPGESDGTCNGGPAAGSWWPEYAQALIDNAS